MPGDVSACSDCNARASTASTTVFYDKGVLQSMNQAQPYFASVAPFERMYGLGKLGSVELTIPPSAALPPQTVAVNGIWDDRLSGMQFIHAGTCPGMPSSWVDGWEGATPVAVSPSSAMVPARFLLTPNDRSFPASGACVNCVSG